MIYSHDLRSQNWFYFNALNGQSSWKHPLEDIHLALVQEYRRKTPHDNSSGIFHLRLALLFLLLLH